MAKKSSAELLAEAQALVKKARELEKTEQKERVEGLGKLTEKFIKGEIAFDEFVKESETISGWKFAGKAPTVKPVNAEISASV